MSEPSPLHQAIKSLGGQTAAVAKIGRKQSTISEALKSGRASAEMCMAIEKATDGEYTCEQLRPDLASLFKTLRSRRRAA